MAAKNNGMKWRRRALAARSGQRASRCHNHRGIAWRREWRDGGGISMTAAAMAVIAYQAANGACA
jgi:hypothetical protein